MSAYESTFDRKNKNSILSLCSCRRVVILVFGLWAVSILILLTLVFGGAVSASGLLAKLFYSDSKSNLNKDSFLEKKIQSNKCAFGYTGVDCSIPLCLNVSNCSNNGKCVSPGICECNSTYTGIDCSVPLCMNLSECSGHGKCVLPNICECNSTYVLDDCNQNLMEFMYLNDSTYNVAANPRFSIKPNKNYILFTYIPLLNSSVMNHLLETKSIDYEVTEMRIEGIYFGNLSVGNIKIFDSIKLEKVKNEKLFNFTYSIDGSSYTSFQIHFTTKIRVGEKVFQTNNNITMVPFKEVEGDYTVLTSKSEIPNLEHTYKYSFINPNEKPEFNGEPRKLRRLEIVAVNYILTCDELDLFDSDHGSHTLDLGEMYILAANVTIMCPIHLAGTKLTIQSEYLVFNDTVHPPGYTYIDLTPIPNKMKSQGNGANGQIGGTFTLLIDEDNIQQYYKGIDPKSEKNFPRFRSKGGAGQSPLDGKIGSDGVPMSVVKQCESAGVMFSSEFPKFSSGISGCHAFTPPPGCTAPAKPKSVDDCISKCGKGAFGQLFHPNCHSDCCSGYKASCPAGYPWNNVVYMAVNHETTHRGCKHFIWSYDCHDVPDEHPNHCGVIAFPGDGGDGGDASKPGDGGNGGSIQLISPTGKITKISKWIDLEGGPAGPKGIMGKGGAAGTPNPAIHMHGTNSYWAITEIHSSKKGKDGKAPTANPGKPGKITGTVSKYDSKNQLEVISPKFIWFNEAVFGQIVEYTKLLFMNGYPVEALNYIRRPLSIVEEIIDDPKISSSERNRLKTYIRESEMMEKNIRDGYDYFGNVPGYVTNYDFKTTINFVQNELKFFIENIYMSQYFNYYWKKDEDSVKSYQQLITNQWNTLQNMISEYNTLMDDILKIEAKIQELQLAQSMLNTAIETEKKKLLDEATKYAHDAEKEQKREQEKPFFMKALAVASVICKCIPIPAVQVVGQVASFAGKMLNTINDDKWSGDVWKDIGNVNGIVDQWDSFHIDKHVKNLFEWTKTNATGSDKLKTRIGDLHKMTDVVSGVAKKINGIISSTKIPDSMVKKFFDEYASHDESLKDISTQLQYITSEMGVLQPQLSSMMKTFSSLPNRIEQLAIGIDSTVSNMQGERILLDPVLFNFINQINRNAQDRFLLYVDYAVRAYMYRLLRPYTGPFDLAPLISQLMNFIQKSTGQLEPLTSEQIETCCDVYKEQIRSFLEDLITTLANENIEESQELLISFDGEKMEELTQNGTTSLDLMSFMLKNEERVLLTGLEIESVDAELGNTCVLPQIDVRFVHSGRSVIRRNGKLYFFQQTDGKHHTRPKIYGSRIQLPSMKIINDKMSVKESEEYSYLFNGNGNNNNRATVDPLLIPYYKQYSDNLYRVSAFTDELTVNALIPEGVKLNKFVMRVNYDFLPILEEQYLVRIHTEYQDIDHHKPSQPFIEISKMDLNGRKDCKGKCLRVYGAGAINITAERWMLSCHDFDHFKVNTINTGKSWGKVKENEFSNNKILVILKDSLDITIVYKRNKNCF